MGFVLGDKTRESVTEHQGSQNEPLWKLKWPLSACSGWLCHVLRLLRPSSGRAQECSPIAQAKAAAAQVQRRKWKVLWEHFHVSMPVMIHGYNINVLFIATFVDRELYSHGYALMFSATASYSTWHLVSEFTGIGCAPSRVLSTMVWYGMA